MIEELRTREYGSRASMEGTRDEALAAQRIVSQISTGIRCATGSRRGPFSLSVDGLPVISSIFGTIQVFAYRRFFMCRGQVGVSLHSSCGSVRVGKAEAIYVPV
jgi:hypothetical protein